MLKLKLVMYVYVYTRRRHKHVHVRIYRCERIYVNVIVLPCIGRFASYRTWSLIREISTPQIERLALQLQIEGLVLHARYVEARHGEARRELVHVRTQRGDVLRTS